MAGGERQDHPPGPALKIARQGPAALALEQRRLRLAETVEVRIAGDDNLFIRRQLPLRVQRGHLLNQTPIGCFVRHPLTPVESRMLEELAGGTRDHKTMMGISRRRQGSRVSGLPSVRVDMIIPTEFGVKS